MIKKAMTACALVALIPTAVLAASGSSVELGGVGPRIGISSNPDQVVFGGQAAIGGIAPDLTFDPSLELGFGDNVTTIAFNFDLHYHFAIQGSEWRPYVGAGIGVDVFQVDLPAPFQDVSNTETGGNIVIGVGVPTRAGNRFFAEARAGLGDLPDLKIIAGWNFKI